MVGSVTGNAAVSMLKGDKKGASYGENCTHTSVSNNQESKGVQSDRKSSTLSKSNSLVTRRGSEMPVPLGIVLSVFLPSATTLNKIFWFSTYHF